MNALQSLSRELFAHNVSAMNVAFPEPAGIREVERQLARKFGAADSGAPPKNLRLAAVRHFLDTNEAKTARELKWLCFGVTDVVGRHHESIITDVPAFTALMRQVQGAAKDLRLFRKCYLGLMHSYFSFDGVGADDDRARTNWLAIRKFLAGNLPRIQQGDTVPVWVGELNQHRNLLTEEPCSRYAGALLDGDDSELEAARQALSISQASWLPNEALLAAVRHACDFKDKPFRDTVPALLQLLDKHPFIKAKGLAAVLQRYSQLASPDFHPELHDAAIEQWGNPLLTRNHPRWHIAGEEATRMVTHWLKGRLIEDFFELLSADGQTDRSRVEFWKRYRDSISDMYFALGAEARRSNDPDFVRLRKTMGSSMLRLDGGASSNNAFLMVMNGFVVMEFGQKGNAAFIFDRDHMPFKLAGTITQTGKSHWSYVARLLHLSASHRGTWQDEFARELRQKVGVVPDGEQTRPAGRRNTGPAAPRVVSTMTLEKTPAAPSRAVDRRLMNELNSRLAQFSVAAVERGNELVVQAGSNNIRLNMVLKELGFQVKSMNEWVRPNR